MLLVTTDGSVASNLRQQAGALRLPADALTVLADVKDANALGALGVPGAPCRPMHLALLQDDGAALPEQWLTTLRATPPLRRARLVVLSRGDTARHLALLRAGFDDVAPVPGAGVGGDLLQRQLAHAERDVVQQAGLAQRERGYTALSGLLQRLRSGIPAGNATAADRLTFVGSALVDALAHLVPNVGTAIWHLNTLVPYRIAAYPESATPVSATDAALLTALRWVPLAGRLPDGLVTNPGAAPEPWRTLGGSAAPVGADTWIWPFSLVDVHGAPAILLLLHGPQRFHRTPPDALTQGQITELVTTAQEALARTILPDPLPAASDDWHTLVAHLPEAMFTLDQHGTLVAANVALASMTERALPDVQGRSVFDVIAPGSHAAVQACVRRMLRALVSGAAADQAACGPLAIELLLPDGRVRPATFSLRPLRAGDRAGDLLLAGVFHEPSGTNRLEREFHAMLSVVRLMASERDLERAIAGVGQVLVEQAGYHSGQVLTLTDDGRRLQARNQLPGTTPIYVPLERSILGRVARSRQTELVTDVRADPDYFQVDAQVTSGIYVPILREERLIGVLTIEEVPGRVLDEHDVTFLQSMASLLSILVERAELATHLEHDATTDLVTQLPNRQTLQQHLDATSEQMQRLAAVSASRRLALAGDLPAGPPQVSVLLAGIDGFKFINELYGHATADDILRQVGATLRGSLAPEHLVARHTSDQFAILLRDTGRDAAVRIAEDLRIAVATRLFTAAEQVEQVTLSIGSATWPDDVGTVQGLLLAADHAMFLAKRAGRNQVFQSNKAFATLAPAHGRITQLLRQSPRETLSMLVRAMDQRLPERQGHSERVARFAVALAHATGFPDEDLSRLRMAAYIHDIGMVSLPDSLLRKPGLLTADEREQLRRVPLAARDLLEQLDEFPVMILQSVVHQRERWDGSGDPDHLAGNAIPRGAQVIAVADAMDAMLHARAHRASVSFDVALEQIRQRAGTQFNPELAEAAEVLRPIAIAVKLEEEQAGVV